MKLQTEVRGSSMNIGFKSQLEGVLNNSDSIVDVAIVLSVISLCVAILFLLKNRKK